MTRLLHVRRVSRVSKGGKTRTVSAHVVVGDGNGTIGYGMGRGTDQGVAAMKARRNAIKNMTYIDRFDNRTIFASFEHQYNKSHIRFQAVKPGNGIVANRNIHDICRLVGISDIGVKVEGSTNPMNVIQGTIDALKTQKTPEDLARIRGRKLIDVQKTYYGFSNV
ncbi:28S ribosomal protein S5, mitochondrial [Rhizophlyctis rosea]|nr:28S ribosomal protein S5, mitochondrial [Rhizophlyctis rosea]